MYNPKCFFSVWDTVLKSLCKNHSLCRTNEIALSIQTQMVTAICPVMLTFSRVVQSTYWNIVPKWQTYHKSNLCFYWTVWPRNIYCFCETFVKMDWTVLIQYKYIYHGCALQNFFYLDNFYNRYCKCSVGNLFVPRRELKVFIIPSHFIHN